MTMNNEELTLPESSPMNGKSDLPLNVATPRADIHETPEAYVVCLDMPGVRKDAIALTVDSDLLQVSADVEPRHGSDMAVLHRELRTTGYRRVFTLGGGVDRNSVDALYEDGVLTVKLFKTSGSKPRTILIK
jgi:HSP20 family protein